MNNLPSEIFANLIASVIGVVLAMIVTGAYKYFTFSRPVKKIWDKIMTNNSRLLVALTSLPTTPEEGNRAVTTVSEATALANLLSLLKQQYKELEIETYPSDRFPTMKLGGCILLTGGPRNNKITSLIFERQELPFHFENHELIIQTVQQKRYSAVLIEDHVVKDYGLIAVMKNPFNEDSFIYLIAGCYAYGVNAAIRIMTWPRIKGLSNLIRCEEYLVIVEADVVDEYVSVPKIVTIHKLINSKSSSSFRKLAISENIMRS